jgi:Uma2 family endonuclease
MTPQAPSNLQQWVIAELSKALWLYLEKNPLGRVFGAGTRYELAPQVVLAPALSFVAKAHLVRLPRRFDFAPDLALEVVESVQALDEAARSAEFYLHYGARLVWVIDLSEPALYAYRLIQGEVRVNHYEKNDLFDAATILPHFRASVASLLPSIPYDWDEEG